MNLELITAGIIKAEAVGTTRGQIRSTIALWRVTPTTVASHSRFMVRFVRRQQAGLIVV